MTITIKELKHNIDKYIELGQKEEIEVTDNTKLSFILLQKESSYLKNQKKLFGSLPREAYYDKDIDRE